MTEPRRLSDQEAEKYAEQALRRADTKETVDGLGYLGEKDGKLFWLPEFSGPLGNNPEGKLREWREKNQHWFEVEIDT